MVKNSTKMKSVQQGRQQEPIRRLAIVLLLAMVISAMPASQSQEVATNGLCQFAVALPEMEGPVTLGIFSPQGKLVRLLYRDAPVDSLPAGLNGLLVSWDGKDDSGVIVPTGTYRARGIVHGPVTASALPMQDGNALSPISEGCPTPMSAWITFPGNHTMVLSARDALLEKREPLSITARDQVDGVMVEAEGLPLVFIPLNPLVTKELMNPTSVKIPTRGIELLQGTASGTAKLIITRRGRSESYTLVGLDQLVPLDAGSLEMPSDTFHLHREPIGTAGSQQ